jgi:hypothetical protein
MPGLEPGIQAAPSVIICLFQPWMHGSSPCMTELKAQRLFLGVSKGRAANRSPDASDDQ